MNVDDLLAERYSRASTRTWFPTPPEQPADTDLDHARRRREAAAAYDSYHQPKKERAAS